MTQIFNERTKIIGIDPDEGRLPTKDNPEDKLIERELLELILVELKIINMHLAGYSGEKILEEDVR